MGTVVEGGMVAYFVGLPLGHAPRTLNYHHHSYGITYEQTYETMHNAINNVRVFVKMKIPGTIDEDA